MTADLFCHPMVSMLLAYSQVGTESEAPEKLSYAGPAGGASELLRDLAQIEGTARRRGEALVALAGHGPAAWRRRASVARGRLRTR